MVVVQTHTPSAAHMSVVVLTVVVPSVFFGLVAGAYVDRRDKRWVLIGTNLLRAALIPVYLLLPGLALGAVRGQRPVRHDQPVLRAG